MRALGILGGGMGGAPPFAGLGQGQPNATKFLRGDGQWASPSAGALVPLQTQIIANVASVDFTTFNNADYNSYLFALEDVLPATNDVMLYMRLSSNGGASYYSAGYSWDAIKNSTEGGSTNDSQIVLAYDRGASLQAIGNAAGRGISGTVWLHGAGDTAYVKSLANLIWSGADASGMAGFGTGSGFLATATAINAVRFFLESGNFSSGTISMYGLKKA
ncbi:MAG: hypothetical protein HY055_18130 [Magnetospirillum sp.]|nr:hypothetical protein [Magnetospirillum sp.]